MIVLYILMAIIALVLIVAAIVGTGWSYEKSIHINAPVDKVWGRVNTLEANAKWSPWIEKDPNIKQEYTGIDGTPGAKYTWDSVNKNVGAGIQTIVSVTNKAEFVTQIDFIRLFKGTGQGYVKISDEGDATDVRWGIISSTPYPMNIIKIFGIIEKNMDKDFATGLNTLKAICER